MKKLTRDRCYFVGKRARLLGRLQAARAWYFLAVQLEEFGEKDVPKFNDVLSAIRSANILSKGK